MKEKISITIENLDDIKSVSNSLSLLFQKLICYYSEKDLHSLNILVLSCGIYFGKVLQLLGYDGDNFKGEE